MAYDATYTAEDASAVSIDLVVTMVVQILAFASLIVLVFLIGWFLKKVKGFKGN